ncbi:MAG: DUF928 domain-containing protein [Rhodocyclaceae bacterium]|nr:DUF928 domain-containing protein [Rhodocyclaceae bacterium]
MNTISNKLRLATVCMAAAANVSCFAADAAAVADAVQYRPPLRGAPAKRVGGATRGLFEAKSPVTIIAPNHVGLTIRNQPTLYWHVAQIPAGQVVFRLIAQDTATIVDERILPDSACTGFYRLNFAAAGLTLKPEVTYRWQIAIAPAQPDARELIAGGAIRYATSAAPPAGLGSQTPSERQRSLAGAGIWYDVVDEFMNQLKASPADTAPAAGFGDLLGQVGIPGKLAGSAICF